MLAIFLSIFVLSDSHTALKVPEISTARNYPEHHFTSALRLRGGGKALSSDSVAVEHISLGAEDWNETCKDLFYILDSVSDDNQESVISSYFNTNSELPDDVSQLLDDAEELEKHHQRQVDPVGCESAAPGFMIHFFGVLSAATIGQMTIHKHDRRNVWTAR